MSTAPVAQDPTTQGIPLTQATNFQKALADQVPKSNGANLKDLLAQIATAFISPPSNASFDTAFVTNNPPSAYASKFLTFAGQLNAAAAAHALTVQDVTAAAQSVFGAVPGDVVKTSDFIGLQKDLRDSVVAIKLAQVKNRHTRQLEVRALIFTFTARAWSTN